MSTEVMAEVDRLLEKSKVTYHRFEGSRMTLCHIRLPNGYEVLGTASCVFDEDFDASIGASVAWGKAREAAAEVVGYALRSAAESG